MVDVLAEVSWSNDRGRTWTPAEVVSGTVKADRTSQTRWSIDDLTLAPDTPLGLDGVNAYSTRFRVRRGERALRGSPVWTPLGVYRVSDTSEATDGTVQVQGTSLEAAVRDARLLTPRMIGGGGADATARTVVEALIREAVPDAGFVWNVAGDQGIPTTHQDTDRWGFIDGAASDQSIARALGAEVYCDGQGAFVVAPTPTLYDDPVWEVRYGDALVKAATALSREGVYNVVVANGQSTDSSTPPAGPGIAWDNDPDSPTYAGPDPVRHPELAGPFGVVPRFYTSYLLTSMSQCQAAANALLADALGLHKTVTFDSVVKADLVPGQAGRVEVRPGVLENHLIDSVSFDLTSVAMSCQTRATTSRLLGLGGVLAAADGGDVDVSGP